MLKRTQQNYGIRAWQKCMGGARVFQDEPNVYLKHSPGNPWFGLSHDGVSNGYGEGFTRKTMNWVYRYRWNSQHRGASTLAVRNPGGKTPHWLEVSQWKKLKPHVINYEALPHSILLCVCVSLVIWNLARYVFFHPDLTIYNIIYFTMRRYVDVLRNQEIPNLDTPVFRWVQVPTEFYGYNPTRDFVAMGVCANDPYLEYMKAIGKADLLLKMPQDQGYNTALHYLPKHQWGWSYKETKGSENPVPTAGAPAAHH